MSGAQVRPPAVAGSFYPADATELARLVSSFLDEVAAEPSPAPAAVVPHAGLVYSGQCAAHVFKRVAIPPVTVLVGPNHRGHRSKPAGASVWAQGAFALPGGQLALEEDFAAQLLERCTLVADDPIAHAREHSLEVELPFLFAVRPDVRVVPVVLAWDDWRRCRDLAVALAELVTAWPEDVLLLASTDMTHYETATAAARKDRLALDDLERLDAEAMLATCHRERISMCGRAAATVVAEAARRLGAARAEVVDYRHSGWVTGDDSSVVAYAGAVIR